MKKFTADAVYPVSAKPIPQGVVVVDDDGTVLSIGDRADHDPASLQALKGTIVPGFVNSHCHIELSHMKGRVDTGTGLIPFITAVVQTRGASEDVIREAIADAEREMKREGIVAVGDISNSNDSFHQKEKSDLFYYTFVEMFDLLQADKADEFYDQYLNVFNSAPSNSKNKKSCVPHAPYTVSPELFEKVVAKHRGEEVTVSIHNQEMVPENDLFLNRSGGLIDFYNGFDISLRDFKPTGKTSIYYALEHLDPTQRTLFVHNTLTTPEEIRDAHEWSPNVFWATCPNANLYIENSLPDYKSFIDNNARMTIGTDSLTSNWQLSVLEEMKTIAKYQSYVPFDTLLRWATLNGAEALGLDGHLGSIESGKTPGLVLLSFDAMNDRFGGDVSCDRLI